MIDLSRIDAREVLAAYVRERHRRGAARALPLGSDRIQASPTLAGEDWWTTVTLLVQRVPEQALDVWELLVVGHDGSAWDPTTLEQRAVPMSHVAIGRKLKCGKFTAASLERLAVHVVNLNLLALRLRDR